MVDDVFFEQLRLGPMDNFSYVFGSRAAGKAAITDPGFELDKLLGAAADAALEVSHIVVTHSHRDHVAELDQARKVTGAPVVAHPGSPVGPEVKAEDRTPLELAGIEVLPLHTPGHCPDHVAFVVADRYLLTGDAVFIGECGRVDLPGSDVDAMHRTLTEVIPSLPGHLEVYPGHDYGPVPHRSLEAELAENYTLEPRDLEAFRRFMAEP